MAGCVCLCHRAASFTYFGEVLRCPHKRIVTITKVYIAGNTIHVEIFFRDQQHIVYEIRLIAICEVSPPFGEEHHDLEQDISFPANRHLLILGKCYAVHINAASL